MYTGKHFRKEALVKFTQLALLSAILAGCTLAYSNTVTFDGLESNPPQNTFFEIFPNPATYTILVPQFNPQLGTLESIDYSISDSQFVLYSVNDGSTELNLPYTLTVTPGASSNALNANLTAPAKSDTYTTVGSRQLSSPLEGFQFALSGSGTVNPIGAFIGTGFTSVDFTSSPTVDSPDAAEIGVRVGVFSVQDHPVLDITYNFTSVPEPRALFLIGLATLLIARFRLAAHQRIG